MTLYNRISGLLMAMLIIFLEEYKYEFDKSIIYESFVNQTTMSANDFRKNFCVKQSLTDGKGKPAKLSNFPNIKFTNEQCEPCSPECDFTVTTENGNDQIYVQDLLQTKDSATLPIP
jgi:hypothetical protein